MYRRSNSRGLGDTTTVQSQIVAAANQYGVPPNLALAVAKQESGYQQYNSSGGVLQSKPTNGQPGALGVMQLEPATAASLGVDPTDQAQNIQGGVKLLSQLLTQFNGDTSKALAAYNAGPANVIKYGGVPPFAETQNYVASITANYNAMGGGSASTPDTSGSAATDPTATGLDWASLFTPVASDPSSAPTYDVAGLVLTQNELLGIGAAIVGTVLVFSIL